MIHDVCVRDAGIKGKGVFARRSFQPGEFIFRRRYERRVTTAELAGLSTDEIQHLCELDFDTYAVLLPPGSFVNHSCDPNAMRSGVKVFSRRLIRTEEEITIDYRLNAFDDADRWQCHCGAENCEGEVVGSFFTLPPERQCEYLPYAPKFIWAEYRRRARRNAERSAERNAWFMSTFNDSHEPSK